MAEMARPGNVIVLAYQACEINGRRPTRVVVDDLLGRPFEAEWHQRGDERRHLTIRLDWMTWQAVAHGQADWPSIVMDSIERAA